MSTCAIAFALAAVKECSTLNRPFALAGISPMVLPDLFLILQDQLSKLTE